MNETWKIILNRLFVMACDRIDEGTGVKKLEKAINKEYRTSITELIEFKKVKVRYSGSGRFSHEIQIQTTEDVQEIINHEGEFFADLNSLLIQYVQENQNG